MHDWIESQLAASDPRESMQLRMAPLTHLGYQLSAIDRWIYHGIHPGDYLASVLSGDLLGVFQWGSDDSIACLPFVMRYLWNESPPECWQSKANVAEWPSKQDWRTNWTGVRPERETRARECVGG